MQEINNKRIAKNTIFLYIRMLVLMFVTFFTSRVVLNTLGIVDFGINNVVGGLALMFVFFRSSLANVTQRDLNIEIGKHNKSGAIYIFRLHQSIYIIIAIIVAIAAETIGLWFVCNKLVIPPERMGAALWVYHFTIASLCVTIISVVYDSVLIAHEDMKIYSYVGIVEGVAKLLIAYMLLIIPFDRLATYGVLLFLLAVGLRIFYAFYCSKHYEECNFSFLWNKTDVKRTFTFISWNTIGCLVYIINEQGINMLLNIFFGPAINAARGISYQVSGAIRNFANNFYTAVRPQMTKSYAVSDFENLKKLFLSSSKFSVYLIWFFILPIMFCVDPILKMWLGTVPQYTNIFTQLVLVYAIVDTLNTPIWSLALSTGDLKRYIIYGNIVFFLAFPISYVFLKISFPATSVFLTMIVIRMIYIAVVLKIICDFLKFSVKEYLNKVIIPSISIIIISYLLLKIIVNEISFIHQNIMGVIVVTFISILVNAVLIFSLGLSKKEREVPVNMLNKVYVFCRKNKKQRNEK